MDPELNFDEKLEKDSLTACKKCYQIVVRKPTYTTTAYHTHFRFLDSNA